jgi:microcystin degradation protein MlrC
MTRVLLAGLFHETHCFTDDTTGIDQFRIRRGAEITALLWRSLGIEPTALSAIALKSAATSYTVTTRGPCTSDPRLLPYARLRRPVFPLDALD